MNTETSEQAAQPSIFENSYDKEVLEDNLAFDRSRTMRALLIIGGVILFGDLFALIIAQSVTGATLGIILIVPAIFLGLGLLARQRPMTAISLGAALYIFIVAVNIYSLGAKGILSGWLLKAVTIYFIISGFRHAKEAEDARRKLELFR